MLTHIRRSIQSFVRRSITTVLFVAIASAVSNGAAWHEQLAEELPVMGHRNWIVIADSAYPSQTAPGIQTIYAGGDQIAAVEHVLKTVDSARHVRAKVMVDDELKFVPESHATGIQQYRDQLRDTLANRDVQSVPHADIIKRLDVAGQTFHVLIIKTDLTLPYTSVFIELDAGYWSAEAEAAMRKAIEASK